MDEESFEIGLAATLSLSDLVFVGHGFNLQASDDRTLGFFSFRLLEIPGVFGQLRVEREIRDNPLAHPRFGMYRREAGGIGLCQSWPKRLATMRTKQIEVINDLHQRALEIEQMELSDGKGFTHAVRVNGRSDQGQEPMSDAEAAYLAKQVKWREQLRMEVRRARLLIDGRTVSLVSTTGIIRLT